ncbi:carbonic anhydrase 1-like [Achroia grisella]|uniref:carbonic anhydrase 1-like n=1 Tax=Achroia grisella TaxID=688607 RepID=UPI0027D2F08F|nr:carbonic anhydrase 1-like [Achroia grisella]
MVSREEELRVEVNQWSNISKPSLITLVSITETRDQTTPRANTLYDDADDLQKQLDSEDRDRLQYGLMRYFFTERIILGRVLPSLKQSSLPMRTLAWVIRRSILLFQAGFALSLWILRPARGIFALVYRHTANAAAKRIELVSPRSPLPSRSSFMALDHLMRRVPPVAGADCWACDGPAGAKPADVDGKGSDRPGGVAVPAAPHKEWDYKGQDKWSASYPGCGGRSQSPVDLPVDTLVRTKGARPLLFCNYDVMPTSLTLENYGQSVKLYGEWKNKLRPLVYGGAAHSRRYLFHSLTLHWPSEHAVGGLQYPLEIQVLHISAEFSTIDEALEASPRDHQAILGIASLYKFDNHTQKGLSELLKTASAMYDVKASVPLNPLSYFSPPLKEYACYQGSITTPPCTESVLWLIRGRTLSVTREHVELFQSLLGDYEETGKMVSRRVQPLNDRKTFYFS